MKLSPTILNVPAVIFIVGCIVYSLVNYSTLSYAGGWGVAFMVGLMAFGATALVVDLIIRNVVTSARLQRILQVIALAAYCLLFWLGM